jgi:hypothetical protein
MTMKFLQRNSGSIFVVVLSAILCYQLSIRNLMDDTDKDKFLTECDTVAPHAVDLDAVNKTIRDVYSCPDGVLYLRNKK